MLRSTGTGPQARAKPEEYRRAIATPSRGQVIEWHRRDAALPARPDGEAQIASHEVAELSEVVAATWQITGRATRAVETSPWKRPGIHPSHPPALLGQAIHNILENAIKYSEPGTAIEIRVGRTETGVEVSIRDKGRGIS